MKKSEELQLPKSTLRASKLVSLTYSLLTKKMRWKRPHILIACMPKSGSTFLSNLLAACEGLQRVDLVPAYGAREQELCEISLLLNDRYGYVAQQHVRNSKWTQIQIQRYGLTPIVLVRNLYDVVVSLRDHIRKESPILPMAHYTDHHLAMPDDALEDAIVQLAMPWYVHFYTSWQKDPKAMMVRYEDLIENPVTVVSSILEQAKVAISQTKVLACLEKVQSKNNRYNIGVVGRGRNLLPETRQKLKDMFLLYPELHDDPLWNSYHYSLD